MPRGTSRAAGVAGEQVEEDPQRGQIARDRAVALAEEAGAQQRERLLAARPRRDVHRKREVRDLIERQADRAQPRLVGARALLEEVLHREAEALGVERLPARRDRHAQRPRQDLADDVDDRVLRLDGSGFVEVGEQPHAERDVALLVERDVADALAEAGHEVERLERRLDDVLAGLRERPLDDDVVERHRLGELARRMVAAQLGGHRVEAAKELAMTPRELRQRGAQAARQGAVADARDLVHEAVKEDRMARLVDLLRREEVLLLLERRRVDVRREVVGDRVLAVEEQRVQPQRRGALLRRELLLPVDAVGGEVDLGRAPVAALPAGIEIGVVDLLRRGWDRHGHAPPGR